MSVETKTYLDLSIEARRELVAKLMFAFGMTDTGEEAKEAIEDADVFDRWEWFVLAFAKTALERKNKRD